MKKTLQVINDLKNERIISDYAIGGATALLFYTEPALTFDVDIFIFLPEPKNTTRLINLGPLYQTLEKKGYQSEKEHVLIEGVPVQFIPAYNELVKEAVEQAPLFKYEDIDIKVLKIEHLLAIMIDTSRPKDHERIKKILEEVKIDKKLLQTILNRHSLNKKWNKNVKK